MVYLVKSNQNPRDISIIDGANDADVIQKLNSQAKVNKTACWRQALVVREGCIAFTATEKLYRAG